MGSGMKGMGGGKGGGGMGGGGVDGGSRSAKVDGDGV